MTMPAPIRVTAGNSVLEVYPAQGGLINRLCLDGVEVVAGLNTAEQLDNNLQYRGVALYPFPNRLDEGRYRFNGRSYQFDINEPERDTALHGFLYRLPAEVVRREDGDTAVLELHYKVDESNAGYPFAADVSMHYRLDSRGLELVFTAVNRHPRPVPVGLGWHPYFQLPGHSVNDLTLQIPAVEHAEVDARLIPSGEFTGFDAFASAQPIGDRGFDDCYRLLDCETARPVAVTLRSPETGVGVEIWQQAGVNGYNFIQLCIPPDRQSIAIEPMTCGINAFNTGDGLIALQPGEELSTRCGVRTVN